MAEKFGCYQIDHEGSTSIGHRSSNNISISDVKLIRELLWVLLQQYRQRKFLGKPQITIKE